MTTQDTAPRTDTPPPLRRHQRGGAASRSLARQAPWLLLAVGLCVMVLLPIVPLQWRAFEGGADGLRRLAAMPDLGSVLGMTLFIGLGALLVAMILGVLLALSMHAIPPRLRKYLAFAPVLPMVIPAVAHVVGFVFLFSPSNGYVNTALRATPLFDGQSGPINVYTPFWIIVYTGVNLAAFVYLFVYTGLRNLGTDYALAARVSGANGIRALVTVTLPLLRPVLVYAGVVCLLLSLGQFTGPLILGRREGVNVVTTRMFELTIQYPIEYGLVASLGTPLIVLALVIVVMQKRIIGDQNRFVGQVGIDNRIPNRWLSAGAVAFLLLFTILSAVLPLLALVLVALSPFWSGRIDLATLSLNHFTAAFDNRLIVESINTSITISVIAIMLVIPLGMVIALGIYNRDKLWWPLPPILDFAASLPLSLPAAVLGFGFLFAFTHESIAIYGTRASLVIAYITIMIPYAVRYQLATLVAMGRQTIDASRASGAGPLRTFFLVILPLARGGIASSATIMFVLLSHEFGVSLLLRAPDVNVMSVVLFQQYDGGTYPQVAVVALIMTAITGMGVIAAVLFGGTRAFERL